MQRNKNSKLVYSTNPDEISQEGLQDISGSLSALTAYIERDRKMRKGKVVTVISRLQGNLKVLQKELQKQCGAGGSVKNGNIEIQGDHRDKIAQILQSKGFKTKFIGG
jgi:translation initiation factor 1